MSITFKKKDKKAFFSVLSGICGNVAAGWFALIIIVPGFSWPQNVSDWILLTRIVLFGIVFLLLAYFFERKTQ